MGSLGMWGWRRWLGRFAEDRERRRLHGRVKRALQLPPRGGCGDDSLAVKHVSTELRVEWGARDVHPWDRDLPAHQRHELFLEQCRRDTIVAVQRLFDQLIEIDVIEIRVVEPPPSSRILLAGTVSRHDLTLVTTPSSRMQLKLMGIDGDTISWPATSTVVR
jgi:hypothetical protein